jgi:hypothetical protein
MKKATQGFATFFACAAFLFCLSACDDPLNCAKEGEKYSPVYSEYPAGCCDTLTAWASGMDTRISIGDTCYETGLLAGSPVGTCINCGNGVCEELENVCNCEADCSGGINSKYADAEAFCAKGWNGIIKGGCSDEVKGYPICGLCPPNTVDNNTLQAACKAAGGTVGTSLCCGSVSDFPDLCVIGACGCGPNASHEVLVCRCTEGQCWDSKLEDCVTED